MPTLEKNKVIFYVGVIVILMAFLASVSGILMPFVFGGILAYLLDPIVDKFEKYINRSLLSFIVVSFAFSIIVLIMVMSVPAMLRGIQEVGDLLVNSEEIIKAKIIPFLNVISPVEINQANVINLLQTHSQEALKYMTQAVKALALSTFKVFDFFTIFLITPIALYYMLKDWDKMVSTIESLLPKGEKNYISQVFNKINAKLSNFIRGQLLVCLCLGLFYATGLSLVGLKLGLLIGFLTGLFSFMPYVGMAIGVVASFILAYLQFPLTDVTPFVMIAGVFALGQILEGGILSPKLVGKALNLHPLWVIFAILAGGELKGFLGILIALPVCAIVSVLVNEALEYYKSTKIYTHNSRPKTKSKGRVKTTKVEVK